MRKSSNNCGKPNRHGLHDLEVLCFGMDEALNYPASRKLGITPMQMFKDGNALGYLICAFSGKHTKRGLVMRRCPWCGRTIYKEKPEGGAA